MVPVNPFSCPKCQNAASAQPAVQACGRCGLRFVLRAGARVDPNVRPPPIDPTLKQIKTTSAGTFVRNANIVAPAGVMQGTLDPVTGMIPMDTSGIAYQDVLSIAVWRELDILRVVLAVLILAPAAFGLIYLTLFAPVTAVATVPLLALFGFAFYAIFAIKKNLARVCGSQRVLVLQFESPMWRRMAFHDEMNRRAGLPPATIP